MVFFKNGQSKNRTILPRGMFMTQTHDFTKILWGDEFFLEAPLKGVDGVVTGQGNIARGDRIVLCVQCTVDAVDHYLDTPDLWQAKISFDAPVSTDSLAEGGPLQGVKSFMTQLGETLQPAELYHRVEQMFTFDRLTQISNRGRFEARLTEEWRRLRRERTSISLIVCSIEGLAAYQSAYDKTASEQIVIDVAQVLQSCCKRPSDMVARYREDTFVALLPNTDEPGASHVCNEMKALLAKLPLMTSQRTSMLAIGIGSATLIPDMNLEPQELVQLAVQSQRVV
jgi:diguanylate cyclase (GGDEF)-like protein